MKNTTTETLATELAEAHKITQISPLGMPFAKCEIEKHMEALFDQYYIDAEAKRFDREMSDTVTEWLVDNYYAIKIRFKGIKKSLKTVPRDMPVLANGAMRGFPRIYAAAVEYIDLNGGVVSESGIIEFLRAYQSVTPLTLDELWSLETVFSLVLAHSIMTAASRKYESLLSLHDVREAAQRAHQNGKRDELKSYVNTNDVAKLAEFIIALQNRTDSGAVLRWLDSELSKLNLTANDVLEFARRIESNCVVTIRNSITSLMKINMFDWEHILEAVSGVDAVFENDPDGTYPKMDPETKNIYRRYLKKRAKHKNMSEVECAELIIYEAKNKNCHIGEILLPAYTKRHWGGKLLYFVSIYSLSFALLAGALYYSGMSGTPVWIFILSVIPMLIISRAFAVNIINYIASKLKKPTRFLRFDYEKGIPPECKTVIAVPALIVNKEQAKALVSGMEVNYLANKSKNINMVLVGDYVDSDCEIKIDDDDIKSFTAAKIDELNQKYGKKIFFYMQRPRLYNKTQNKWLGWERKRGAVIQFNKFLTTGDLSDFCYNTNGIEAVVGSKYVITLDADTKMPRESAFTLVATLDHPMNRPVFDPKSGKVISGYGILQPRMDTSLPSATKSKFSGIVSGEAGSQPYSGAVSEVYQDVFGEGSFGGKGIYDSKVFYEVINKRFPENRILSHDMIEGGFLKAGYVSDIVFVDDVPSSYASYRKRQHRWMRGDWQLLPYLMPYIENEDGKNVSNTLNFITKYKIMDNMIRTLLEPSVCLLVIFGVFYMNIMTAALILYLARELMPAVLEFINWFKIKYINGEHKRMTSDVISRPIINLFLTADNAASNADAAVRTLYRLKTKKRLLEWQTAMQSESKAKSGIKYYYNIMQSSVIFGAIVLAFGIITLNYAAVVLGAAFVTAPYLAAFVSRKKKQKCLNLTGEEENIIEFTARGAWEYFKELCTVENNFIPPDNFQTEPYKGATTRTSPTNIGMMLCGAVAAERLELTSPLTAAELISKAVKTLQKLEKWNGQPYNWYDITTLKPLYPMFVSTADNGNLACALIVVREALGEYIENVHDHELKEKIKTTLSDIREILKDMNFRTLYDEKKGLFAVGYEVEANKLSDYAYDMLASEARQASFYAIISGAVGVRHWSRLSRIVVKHSGNYILKSWSGSMFEYLMPHLFFRTYDRSLWSNVFKGVVREQKRYASKARRPWGISESGHWQFDDNKYYQYKAFGIPSAAVRHTKTGEYVVAPYASALALAVAPKAASKNLIKLKDMGLTSRFGFYEAVDLSDNSKNIIKSHMAHHEGMSLIAAANVLKNNCIVELFHKAPEVMAGEILLEEKLPATVARDALPKASLDKAPEINDSDIEEVFNGITKLPHCGMLTNGRLSAVISNSGAASVFCSNTLINKWRSDEIAEPYGHFIFIKDRDHGKCFSATPSPSYDKNANGNVIFKPECITFTKTVNGLEVNLKITAASDKNAVVYALSLKNTHTKTRHLTVADYFDPALESYEENFAHPQYSQMFLESKYIKDDKMILVSRTSRSTAEVNKIAAVQCVGINDIYAVTSKYNFIGRNRSIQNPVFASPNYDIDKSQNSLLMPMASIMCDIDIEEGETKNVYFILSYGESYDEIYGITRYFSIEENCAGAFELSYEHSKISVRYKQIDQRAYKVINAMLSAIYYSGAYKRSIASKSKSFLWQFGISGDVPIICCDVENEDISGIRLVLKAYEHISSGGVKSDLVIITHDDGYHKNNYELVTNLIATSPLRNTAGKKGGIFVIRKEINRAECDDIRAFAVINVGSSESSVLNELIMEDKYVLKENVILPPRQVKKESSRALDIPQLQFFNGYGGYNPDTSEYTVLLDNNIKTPHPWSHIMANESFGTLVTESGGGFSWYKNSRENKLNNWSNDVIGDMPSEAVYIKDDAAFKYMTPERITGNTGRYRVDYGQGYARFSHNAGKISAVKTVFVPKSDSVKISILDIKNDSDTAKKISLYYYTDVKLSSGTARVKDDITVKFLKQDGFAYAVNNSFPENGYMFLSASEPIEEILTRKLEFFGRYGDFEHPRALDFSSWLRSGGKAPADCIVLKMTFQVKPHYSKRVILSMGAAENVRSIRPLVTKYSLEEKTILELNAAKGYYKFIAEPIKLSSGNKALDFLYNNFLLYQVYVCRYTAKTSFYQCSGAYGFRDQLQDVIAFMYTDKVEAKRHILRAASQQFEEGDVRHWWHEKTNCGIRTKMSDDMLFLPYVATEYAEFTGDYEIFNEEVPFVTGQKIEDGKDTHFGKAYFTDNTQSLYDHCMLAIKRATRIGQNGLPLIGTGDWNDGFDKIGKDGKGESVWLAFFMHYVIEKFKEISEKVGRKDDVHFLEETEKILLSGIDRSAWDGEWFRRAYYDDGTPVGSSMSDECKIDLIAQCWAAISGTASTEKVKTALMSAEKHLVDEENKIVKLLSPPFDKTDKNPGYIKAYKNGVRENGGQYTHAAVWLIMAYAKLNDGKNAMRIINMINPVNHALTKQDSEKYKVEPYVVAADVYSVQGNEGMGGWTWYTGSAAWLYKVITEYILGIKITGNIMRIKPVTDKNMLPFRIEYNYTDDKKQSKYIIDVIGGTDESVLLDGEICPQKSIKLSADDNIHKVKVVVNETLM